MQELPITGLNEDSLIPPNLDYVGGKNFVK